LDKEKFKINAKEKVKTSIFITSLKSIKSKNLALIIDNDLFMCRKANRKRLITVLIAAPILPNQ
jgi:hypothetical protein